MAKTKPAVGFHKDATVVNKGQTLDGEMHGYWEYFRKDGVIMRSGHFYRGECRGYNGTARTSRPGARRGGFC